MKKQKLKEYISYFITIFIFALPLILFYAVSILFYLATITMQDYQKNPLSQKAQTMYDQNVSTNTDKKSSKKSRKSRNIILIMSILFVVGLIGVISVLVFINRNEKESENATGDQAEQQTTEDASQVSEQETEELQAEILWEYDLDDQFFSKPVFINDLVCFGSNTYETYGAVFCLNKTSGEKEWEFTTEGAIFKQFNYPAPEIADICLDNKMFVSSNVDGKVYSISVESGEKEWEFYSASNSLTKPYVYEEVVYVGFLETVYGFDSQTGNVVWEYTSDVMITSPVIIADGVLYIGTDEGNLQAVEVQTGQKKWEVITDDPSGTNQIYTIPTITEDTIYFATEGLLGYMYAVDISTGEILWKFNNSPDKDQYEAFFTAPIVSDEKVFFGIGVTEQNDDGDIFVALDKQTGEEEWSVGPIGSARNIDLTNPAISEEILFFGTNMGELYGLDVILGKRVLTFQLDESVMIRDLSIKENTIYFGAGNTFYAVALRK